MYTKTVLLSTYVECNWLVRFLPRRIFKKSSLLFLYVHLFIRPSAINWLDLKKEAAELNSVMKLLLRELIFSYFFLGILPFYPPMQFKVRMHPSNQQWTTTLYRTTWTYWGWFLACVLWCWESNGLHGSPFTVPAFHLPTQNSTMIPSKLCQALCCQFLLLLCLTCKILLQWHCQDLLENIK